MSMARRAAKCRMASLRWAGQKSPPVQRWLASPFLAHHGAAADGALPRHAEVGHVNRPAPTLPLRVVRCPRGGRPRLGAAAAAARRSACRIGRGAVCAGGGIHQCIGVLQRAGHRRQRGGHGAHHLGNHVARPPHDDLVAHPHALLADLEQVVQRGVGDGDAAHEDRRQPRHGRELAGAADLHVDAFHARDHLLRRIFVCHSPARLAGDEAQLPLQRQAVDLVDHAVDVVGKLVAAGAHLLMEGHQFSSAQGRAHLVRDRKAPAFQLLQQGVVGGEVRPPSAAGVMSPRP